MCIESYNFNIILVLYISYVNTKLAIIHRFTTEEHLCGQLAQTHNLESIESIDTGMESIDASIDISDLNMEDIDTTPLREAQLPIVWILGGPGSGKGTQSAKIEAKYGLIHLSIGQLLRDLANSDPIIGQQLMAIFKSGGNVPSPFVISVLTEAMIAKLPGAKGFILDGFPRRLDQAQEFERKIGPCQLLLYLDVGVETLASRLIKRGQTSGRLDDNMETIPRRLNFRARLEPVLAAYAERCVWIPADQSRDNVFEAVSAALDQHLDI